MTDESSDRQTAPDLESLPAWSNIPASTEKREKDAKPELPPKLADSLAELRKVLFS